MRKYLLLSLLLLATLTLAACGEKDDATPMPTDGGDEAQIQLDPTDPLVSYLDLSQLDQETLAACTQDLTLESENNGVTMKLHKAMGDAMTLYLTLDVIYPETMELQDPRTYGATLTEMTLTVEGGQTINLDVQVQQIQDYTMSYILRAACNKEVLTQGKAVTLALSDDLAGGSTHTFQWTVETQAPFQYADLKDDAGTMVGTVILSPFALSSDVWKPDDLDQDQVVDNLVLLDLDGNAISHNAAGVGAGTGTLHLEYRFFAPVDLSTAATVQIGPYSAQLNP